MFTPLTASVVVVTAVYLNRALFAPIGNVLDERQERVNRDAQERTRALEASEQKIQAYQEQLRAARKEAWDRREVIRGEAMQARADRLQKARDAAMAEIATARDQIDADASAARDGLKDESEILARRIAATLLGREVAQG